MGATTSNALHRPSIPGEKHATGDWWEDPPMRVDRNDVERPESWRYGRPKLAGSKSFAYILFCLEKSLSFTRNARQAEGERRVAVWGGKGRMKNVVLMLRGMILLLPAQTIEPLVHFRQCSRHWRSTQFSLNKQMSSISKH